MKAFLQRYHVAVFFSLWLLLNLVQAAQTQLMDDEAYYWVYSRFMDWGYFDHPPMIGLMIKLGYALFHNELGVRLLVVFAGTASLWLIRKLLPVKNDTLFYLMACSMAVFQIGGIIAVPDIPLIFFTTLFFYVYKKFLEKESWTNSLLLGLVMALLLYSKYHGVLVIFFTLLSNPKLALRLKAWVAVLAGIVLFMPHLYWQYMHQFPSVQYHLFERNASAYRFSFTLEYIGGQLLLAGPLVGWLLIWAAWKYKTRDLYTRALRFTFIGLYIFFLISTFKGRVEANWLVPALVPVMILAHQYLINNRFGWKILRVTVPITLALVLIVRVFMMLDIDRVKAISKDEFHGNRAWAASIQKVAGETPVVFINSYQLAAKYWFYSGHPAMSLNTPYYRRNNYNFWPLETNFEGKKAMVLSKYDRDYFVDSVVTPFDVLGYKMIDPYYSFSGVLIKGPKKIEVKQGVFTLDEINITCPYVFREIFPFPPFSDQALQLYIFKNDERLATIELPVKLSQLSSSTQIKNIAANIELPKGEYVAAFAVPNSVEKNSSLNSTRIPLVVE